MALEFEISPEQQALKESARQFAVQEIIPKAAEYDEAHRFPEDIARKAWEASLVNPQIPVAYGGRGCGVVESCLITEELNYGCSGIANFTAANNLAVCPLLIAGSEEQKKRYLGWLVDDLAFAAFALTEPGAGSDAAAISATYQKVGEDYVINGTKTLISNGSVAHWYVVVATRDRSLRHKGISCFVLPADRPGIVRRRLRNKLGQLAGDTSEVVFEDVKVSSDALLGAEGEGFKLAMMTFDRTRPEIAAVGIGIAQRALDESLKYALRREAFGETIANFQAVQIMLADMAIELEAMRLLSHKAAWLLDRGAASSIVSSYAKAFGGDAVMRIATDAVQIFGGYGYLRDYPVEKLMRDAKLVQLYEGTSQIQRIVIVRDLIKRYRQADETTATPLRPRP